MEHVSDDHDLHQMARRYAFEHNVSYSDALKAVVGAQALNAPRVPDAAASDAELDARAMAYAREHGVSYVDALRGLIDRDGLDRLLKRVGGNDALSPDAALDAKFRAHAITHRVSYAEAIDQLQGKFVSFREASVPIVSGTAADMMSGQQIEIFTSGNHVSSEGASIPFTKADIDAIATGYNPRAREAPLTIGHPEDDKPAYGWVAGLQSSPDGRLLMRVRQVLPAFAEMVREGRFKKRSASFYPPHHPSNPTPGRYYLRHVAFLGAQPPAVAGLTDIF